MGLGAGIHWILLEILSALRYIPSLNSLKMMPTSREGTKDFKMSLAIFSNSVIPLPGLYLGSNYSRSGAHSSDAPKESAVFCAQTSIKPEL